MNPAHRSTITPLSPRHYRLQVTLSSETYLRLRQLQELLRHTIPSGDPVEVIDRALVELLEKVRRKKFGAKARPRPVKPPGESDPRPAAPPQKEIADREHAGIPDVSAVAHLQSDPGYAGRSDAISLFGASAIRHSRYVPADVKRLVWQRDRGRCAFMGRDGIRCGERGALEFHHVTPFARGGQATVANLQLRCRRHNGYEAEIVYGSGFSLRDKNGGLKLKCGDLKRGGTKHGGTKHGGTKRGGSPGGTKHGGSLGGWKHGTMRGGQESAEYSSAPRRIRGPT